MKKNVIFGFGKYGQAVAEELEHKDLKIVVFCEEEKNSAKELGFIDIELLNPEILDEELEKVIQNAKRVVCLLEDEVKNLFLALSIRNLDKKIEIIARAENKEYIHRYKLAGVNKVISPYDIVAKRIDSILKKPFTIDIINSIVFEDTDLYFSQINILKNSFLDGKRMSEIELEDDYNLVIVGIIDREKSNKFQLIGLYDHKIDAGDVLVVVGPKFEIERLKQDMEESTKWNFQ